MHHVMMINPRTTMESPIRNNRNVKKWVCTHPGCGKVFSHYDVALQHEEEHAIRQRLAVATPQADQFLRSVWPTDVPWQDESQFVGPKLLKANQPFACPVPKCMECLPSKMELLRHLRLQHSKVCCQWKVNIWVVSRKVRP